MYNPVPVTNKFMAFFRQRVVETYQLFIQESFHTNAKEKKTYLYQSGFIMYHGKPVNESVAILATSQRQPLKNRQRLQCHSPGLGSSKRKLHPEPAISMARVSLLLIVLSIALVNPSQGFVKELLFRKVKDTLLEDGTTEILDHVCNYRVTPLLQNSELYFKGDVWCPSWTVIKGESLTRSRTRVVNRAIADFARKALAEGLVTQEDAQLFLE